MARWVRQIGVVIGLTVILTFPVTLISGAGSERQPHHVVAGGLEKAQTQEAGVTGVNSGTRRLGRL
jgi:hypothetical protein